MKDLQYELWQLTLKYPERSYSTQASRQAMLKLFAHQLDALGYHEMHAKDLAGRHINKLLALWQAKPMPGESAKARYVNRLLEQWQAKAVSVTTLKGRMAALRWWAGKIGNPGVLSRSNSHYGIPQRVYVPTVSRAKDLTDADLATLTDPYIRVSLQLQRAFGLRREEAIKIRPWQADGGDRLVLLGSWCKGGQTREVPLETAHQRVVLDEAKALVQTRTQALIPVGKTYVQQVNRYKYVLKQARLTTMHGLRHAYAAERFQEISGMTAPLAGGPHQRDMTPAQRAQNKNARQQVSEELGHHRVSITTTYIGTTR